MADKPKDRSLTPLRSQFLIVLGAVPTLEKRYPELKLLPTAEDRARAYQQATHRAERHRDVWLLPLVVLVVHSVAVTLLPTLGVPMQYRSSMRSLSMLLVIASLFWCWLRYRRHVRRKLRQIVNQHRLHICFECGYPLQQSHSHTCPECGTRN